MSDIEHTAKALDRLLGAVESDDDKLWRPVEVVAASGIGMTLGEYREYQAELARPRTQKERAEYLVADTRALMNDHGDIDDHLRMAREHFLAYLLACGS